MVPRMRRTLTAASVLAALTAFNVWTPNDQQTAAVFGLYAALTVIVGLVVRGKVTANKKLP